MTPITTLQELDTALRGAGSPLTLTTSLLPAGNLATFIKALPGKKLVLDDPKITFPVPKKKPQELKLTGTTEASSFGSGLPQPTATVTLTLVFTQATASTITATLTLASSTPPDQTPPTLESVAREVGGLAVAGTVRDGLLALGLGEITGAAIQLTIDLAQKKISQAQVSGPWTLAGAKLDLTTTLDLASKPLGFDLSGQLAKNSPLELSNLIRYLTGLSSPFGDLSIQTLSFDANPSAPEYKLQATIGSDWTLPVGSGSIMLQSVGCTVHRAKAQTSVEVSGSVALGPQDQQIKLTLSGSNAGGGSGWVFNGQTGVKQPIPLGGWLEAGFKDLFGTITLPRPIEDLDIKNLEVTFNTQTKDFTFTVGSTMPTGTQQDLDLKLDIQLTHTNGAYQKSFHGTLDLAGYEFDLIFQSDPSSSFFLATYDNSAGKYITAADLLNTLIHLDNDPILESFAGSIGFDLQNAILVYEPGATSFLLGVDMGAGIDLSHLPLVGQVFPSSSSFRMAFHLLFGKNVQSLPLSTLQPLVPKGFQLPKAMSGSTALEARLWVDTTCFNLDYDFTPSKISTGSGANKPPPKPKMLPAEPSGTDAEPPANLSDIKWFTVQKTVGPFQLNKIGIGFESPEFYFLIDCALVTGALDIALEGLFVRTALSPIQPSFGLHGLSVDFSEGAVNVGGAFLRQDPTPPATTVSYDGAASLHAETFSIGGFGSYAHDKNGQPSLFVYALLDYPIGGPEFFFVTGLSAGFGFNRRLIPPTIDHVQSFPLVAEALSGEPSGGGGKDPITTLQNEINSLSSSIAVDAGEFFFALGVRFTSFDIVNGFALLSIGVGHGLDLAIIGYGTLQEPPAVPGDDDTYALAKVQLALVAQLDTETGFLGIRAKLTKESYLLSPSCHLLGGFALDVWFGGEHAGDFVVTLGGYNPHYVPAPYYPVVSRVGIDWQLLPGFHVSGGAYFALVPNAIMAGLDLDAVWHGGPIEVYFTAGADFLIQWKPYYFNIDVHAAAGLIATIWFFGLHKINVGLGAGLSIWGPDFSLRIHVRFWIISVTIHFGSASKEAPPPLTWGQFEQSFLHIHPANAQPPENSHETNPPIVSVRVESGMLKQNAYDSVAAQGKGATQTPRWTINPKDFKLATNSSIPISKGVLQLAGAQAGKSSDAAAEGPISLHMTGASTAGGITIAPMAITSKGDVTCTHTITWTRDGNSLQKGTFTGPEKHFDITPVLKSIPAAAWGDAYVPDMNGAKFVDNACVGFEFAAVAPKPPQTSQWITRNELTYNTYLFRTSYGWSPAIAFTPSPASESSRRATLAEDIESTTEVRNEVLASLGIHDPVYPHGNIVTQFVVAPQINEPKASTEDSQS